MIKYFLLNSSSVKYKNKIDGKGNRKKSEMCVCNITIENVKVTKSAKIQKVYNVFLNLYIIYFKVFVNIIDFMLFIAGKIMEVLKQ